ncbi:lipid particle protein [Macrolepiota fuliginosa MF-IS2]|uniref:Lipid particle protein n=1 Tax=Macrolepiota fuliginosa MF-IS2 TaxID=1400762 RepID=A0A9P6CAM3_9AGAR|nr:lipid particle protein [Macrolepiota fuliginosa MF-IS2]
MTTKIHLLVMIHGMWGQPSHLAALKKSIETKYPEANQDGEELDILVAETNQSGATYDGIDWGGERVADEVCTRLKEIEEKDKKVIKFSVTGYSLGGLIARYMLGVLHRRGVLKDLELVNFITICTPHLGLLKYPSIVSSLIALIGPKILSKTGEQFYCQDSWAKTGRSLIEVMADPDGIFYQTLSQFKHLRVYANAVNDVTVPYCTSAIETKDIFAEYVSNGIKVEMHKEYEYVIDTYTIPDAPPPKPAPLSQEWFDSLRPRPLLPPAAQFRFPFNIVVYSMLPVLALPVLSYVLYRFSVDSHASRARIKKYESDESYREKLVSMFHELENEIESTAVDVADSNEGEPYPIIKAKLHPVVTPVQKKIAKWLNQLPLKKELAFFPWVRNSHAMIVCRDSHRFPQHKLGESVVQHWADHFIF